MEGSILEVYENSNQSHGLACAPDPPASASLILWKLSYSHEECLSFLGLKWGQTRIYLGSFGAPGLLQSSTPEVAGVRQTAEGQSTPYPRALGIQVYKKDLLWGGKYINSTYFGLVGSQGYLST